MKRFDQIIIIAAVALGFGGLGFFVGHATAGTPKLTMLVLS